MAAEPIYKVIFLNQNQVFELYARQIYQSDLYGFIEVEEYVFGERSQILTVDIGDIRAGLDTLRDEHDRTRPLEEPPQ